MITVCEVSASSIESKVADDTYDDEVQDAFLNASSVATTCIWKFEGMFFEDLSSACRDEVHRTMHHASVCFKANGKSI